MRFRDASALIPLLIDEPEHIVLEQLVRADPKVPVCRGTPLECVSALSRSA